MKYKGIELKEFTSEKPVIFDPPKLKKEETRTLQVILPEEIAERLRKIAEEKDSSISRIIRSAIRLYLTKINR